MRIKPFAAALALVCWTLACNADTITGRVVGVADGDTVTVLDADKVQHKIRLAGIDAPEKAQAFGNRSKQNLSDLVFGKDVRVDWDKRDRYGRIVGKVWVQPVRLSDLPDDPRCRPRPDHRRPCMVVSGLCQGAVARGSRGV